MFSGLKLSVYSVQDEPLAALSSGRLSHPDSVAMASLLQFSSGLNDVVLETLQQRAPRSLQWIYQLTHTDSAAKEFFHGSPLGMNDIVSTIMQQSDTRSIQREHHLCESTNRRV